MRILTLILVFGLTLFAAERAEARQYRYIGPHPLSAHRFCPIQGPHVHGRPPYRRVLFREYDRQYYFVGDPVAYGWEGDRYVYEGHHPIHVEAIIGHPAIEFCYLDGPHYHAFSPAPQERFVVKGGVYWYVGRMPGRYRRERETYAPINTVVAEVHYARPVVTVAPPAGYVNLRVSTPHVQVRAVPPPVFVPLPVPGIVVERGHRGHSHGRHHRGR